MLTLSQWLMLGGLSFLILFGCKLALARSSCTSFELLVFISSKLFCSWFFEGVDTMVFEF